MTSRQSDAALLLLLRSAIEGGLAPYDAANFIASELAEPPMPTPTDDEAGWLDAIKGHLEEMPGPGEIEP